MRRGATNPDSCAVLAVLSDPAVQLPNLTNLDLLFGTANPEASLELGVRFVEMLQHRTALREIRLQLPGQVDDQILQAMSLGLKVNGGCGTLTRLGLSGGSYTDAGISALVSHFPGLTALEVRDNPKLTGKLDWATAGVPPHQHQPGMLAPPAPRSCPCRLNRLKTLDLFGADLATSAAVLRMGAWVPTVTKLDLGENKQLGKAMIKAIRTAFSHLTALHLGDIPALNDHALKAIRIPQLCTLVISHRYEQWCDRKKLRAITDAGVGSLVSGCPALVTLDVAYLRRVTVGAVVNLLQSLPALMTLRAPGVKAAFRPRDVEVLAAAGSTGARATVSVPEGYDCGSFPSSCDVVHESSSLYDPVITLRIR